MGHADFFEQLNYIRVCIGDSLRYEHFIVVVQELVREVKGEVVDVAHFLLRLFSDDIVLEVPNVESSVYPAIAGSLVCDDTVGFVFFGRIEERLHSHSV